MSRKLCDQLKPEKPSSSYADHHHHEINKSEGDSTLKSTVSRHKPGHCGRENEEDELVRYMSKLPGFLEKGGKNREKVLNVGVIDWTRLEQWKESHKHVSHRDGRSSTSSNASSSVSTERLSGHSNPSDQRKFHPSLQSHFMASPMQGHSHAVETPRRSVGNCQNLRGSLSNKNTQSKSVRAEDHLSQKHPDSRLKGHNMKYLDPDIDKGRGIFPNNQMHEAASCAKLGISTQDDGSVKTVETLREPTQPSIDNVVQGTPRKTDPFSHLLPRDSPQNSHCRVPHMPQKSNTYSRLSYSEKPKELFHEYRNHDISHSCPLPDELSYNRPQCKGSGCSSTDLESTKPGSTSSSPLSTSSSPLSVKVGISPSKSGKAEEKKQIIANSSSANKPLHGLDQKVKSENSKSSSAFRRLSISIGYTRKDSDCKEVGHVSCTSSIAALKSSTETSSENVRGCASSKISNSNKPGDEGRSRSSPLRRLLDPLLKPKTAKSIHSLESSQKDSVLTNKNCRSANEKFSTVQPEKEVDRIHRVICSPANTIGSSKDKKKIPSMTQALLRIAVKNGHPLFTFAVDNSDSNILAATVKDLSASSQDECSCIYTFFTSREVKKKNGSWMNQASRSKGPNCIPHAIAQMKVSDSRYYDLTSQNSVDSSTAKEFVLFSVKLEQEDVQGIDYQPIDELGAIVVKVPKAISFIDDRLQGSRYSDSHNLVHATVVLPGGVHSLPINGGPSSLLERWKSGGSCDCGGWDLDCKLKILASGKPRSSKNQLDLFVQVLFVLIKLILHCYY